GGPGAAARHGRRGAGAGQGAAGTPRGAQRAQGRGRAAGAAGPAGPGGLRSVRRSCLRLVTIRSPSRDRTWIPPPPCILWAAQPPGAFAGCPCRLTFGASSADVTTHSGG